MTHTSPSVLSRAHCLSHLATLSASSCKPAGASRTLQKASQDQRKICNGALTLQLNGPRVNVCKLGDMFWSMQAAQLVRKWSKDLHSFGQHSVCAHLFGRTWSENDPFPKRVAALWPWRRPGSSWRRPGSPWLLGLRLRRLSPLHGPFLSGGRWHLSCFVEGTYSCFSSQKHAPRSCRGEGFENAFETECFMCLEHKTESMHTIWHSVSVRLGQRPI